MAPNTQLNLQLPQKLNLRSPDLNAEYARFKRELKRFIDLNEITTEKTKMQILLSALGREAEEQLIATTGYNSSTTLEALLQLANSLFQKKINVFLERHTFRTRTKRPDESLFDYANALYPYTTKTNFSSYSNEAAILDNIILNAAEHIRSRLLTIDNLTLPKAIELIAAVEVSEKWKGASTSSSVNTTKYSKKKYNAGSTVKAKVESSSTQQKTCFRCGSKKHLANDSSCRAKTATCNFCHKTGHYEKMCTTKKKSVNSIEKEEEYVLSIHDSQIQKNKKYINFTSDKHKITFLFDSGSDITILPEKCIKILKVSLQPVKATLRDYNNRNISTLGQASIPLRHGTEEHTVPVIFTQKHQALLGNNILQIFKKINWNTILKTPTSTEKYLQLNMVSSHTLQ